MLKQEKRSLWDTLTFLMESNHTQQAELVLKMVVKETLEKLHHPTDILDRMTFRIPSQRNMKDLRELDLSIEDYVEHHNFERANELFLNYVSQISDNHQKFVALLLTGKNKKDDLNEARNEFEGYYRVGEVAHKLGLSDQTIRRHCENGRYPGAFKTEGGHWRIPRSLFRTTDEQDRKAEEFFERIDQKNKEGGEDVDEFNLI